MPFGLKEDMDRRGINIDGIIRRRQHPQTKARVNTSIDYFNQLTKQKVINLEGNDLSNDGIAIINQVLLHKGTAVRELKLDGNRLTLRQQFANAIAQNRTLRVLSIRNNMIDVKGARFLADALETNKNLNLQEMYLGGNNIGDVGVKILSDALMFNKSLQCIDLSSNNITNKGAQIIAASLLVNTGLRKIWLSSNRIGGEGGEKLMCALNCNYFIEVFDVSGNKISEFAKEKIDRFLKNPSRKECKKLLPINTARPARNMYRLGMYIAETEEKHKGQLAIRDKVIVIKDKHIASLKKHLEKGESGDTIDLTVEDDSDGEEDSEPMKKRPRPNSDIPKKSLASILLEEKSDKLVQVKEERIAAETALEDTKEDLEDTQEEFGNQVLYVNFLQGKIDELVELAEGAGADRSKIAEIKGRLYSSR